MAENSEVKALNTHMVVGLVSLFLTGIALVVLAIVFSIQIGTRETNELFDRALVLLMIQILFYGGLCIILIGALESIGLMSRIKKFLDKWIKAPFGTSASPTMPVIQYQAVQADQGMGQAQGQAQGKAGLRIIRPESGREMELKPHPGASIPSNSGSTMTSKTSPTPTPTPMPSASKPAISEKTEIIPKAASEMPKSSESSEAKSITSAESANVNMTFEDALQNIVDRYNQEKVKSSFKGWENTLMMTFTDLGRSFLFVINGDQGITMSEGSDPNAAVQVSIDSKTFIKMLTKQINPIKAYSSGGLEVKGEMKNMLKLRKLMF